MQVSVIIPVYNAEKYLHAAVESALAQPETAEVLLIDDGSTDESMRLCQLLAHDRRVRVLSHQHNKNLGVSASRNLGIVHATMPYIAFLDADDIYEPHRFLVTKQVFTQHPDADGVHEMIGIMYEDSEMREQYLRRTSGEYTGIRIPVSPEDLWRTLAIGKYGHISPDGLTLKKVSLEKHALYFDTQFPLSEDMDFMLRLASQCRLYGGDVKRIVSKRRVHGKNTVFVDRRVIEYRKRYLEKCIRHHFYGSKDAIALLHILTRRVGAGKFYAPFRGMGRLALPFKLIGIGGYLLLRPKTCFLVLSSFFRSPRRSP